MQSAEASAAVPTDANSTTRFNRFVGGPLNSNDLAAAALRVVFGVILLGQGMA